jgi:hypothetical protein
MIQTDENGQEYKTCARDACGEQFRRRSNEAPTKFARREYCSPRCRVSASTQPAPAKKQVTVERPTGFVNPDGVYRMPGFLVYPGGIEVA